MDAPYLDNDGQGGDDRGVLPSRNRPPPWSPRTLAELAAEAGHTAADLSILAGVERSTISRLWTATDWLDRASGRTLQGLAATVPGVAEYFTRAATVGRLDGLAPELADLGYSIDLGAVDRLTMAGEVQPQHLVGALRAASAVLRRDADAAADLLARSWGRDQDRALGYLFDDGPDRLGDPVELLRASAELADRFARVEARWMAATTLAHHTAKVTGQVLDLSTGWSDGGPAAFLRRSTTIGLIIATGDLELVERYAAAVDRDPTAARIEDWALPAYSRDLAGVDPGRFVIPRRPELVGTGAEVVREVDTFPTAYVHYLALVYLPRAVMLDPTIGGRRASVASAIRRRLPTCPEPTATALTASLTTLEAR